MMRFLLLAISAVKGMSTPFAIVIAGAVIAIAIFGTKLLSPYQLSSAATVGGFTFVWRLNTITGEIQKCDTTDQLGIALAQAKAAGYSQTEVDDYLAKHAAARACR